MSSLREDQEYYRDYLIETIQDIEPASPREWDNLGTIAALEHRNYGLLGDEAATPEAIQAILDNPDYIALPIYAYIHSGIWLSTETWQGRLPQGHAEFDSRLCGAIYVSKEKVKAEFMLKTFTKKYADRVRDILEGEVATFGLYLNGEVYGWAVIDPETDDVLDSCYGYYGDDIITVGIEDAKASIDGMVDNDENR